MKYGKIDKNRNVQIRTINQAEMTAECWSVQFNGLEYCKTCAYKGKNCGGKRIRKTGKNEKGFTVPLV
jgi:hypothetical protein